MPRVSFKNKFEEALSGVLEGDGEPGIIICHGFTLTKDFPILVKLADALVEQGFSVLRFDFSGNGDSEGDFSSCDYEKQRHDILAAIGFMRAKGCSKVGLVGHSMGGAAVLLTASEVDVGAVASLASPAFINVARLKEFAKKYAGNHVTDGFVDNLLRTNIIEAVEKIDSPTLFVHGSDDKVISVSECEELFKHAKEKKRFVVVDGAQHSFHSGLDTVIGEVVQWMNSYLC